MSALTKAKPAGDLLWDVMQELAGAVREAVAERKQLRATVREAAGEWPPDRPMPASLREAAERYGGVK